MEDYKSKIVSVEEAIKAIKNGDSVLLSHAAAAPQLSIKALADHYQDYQDVKIYHMLMLGETPYCNPEMEGHFRLFTNFVGGNTRKAVAEGRADFFPMFFYQVPQAIRDGIIPVDVAIVQVSEPNAEGYCTFGVSCDYTKTGAEKAKIVIAEVNKQMPTIGGNNFIHISDIDYIVEADYPLYEVPRAAIGTTEEAIGRNVAELIQDGDTLQLGIGAIPEAVLLFLKDKKDLGIHTEMFSDGILDLIDRGVITGNKKELDKGKVMGTFLMGTKALYDYVDNNPDVILDSVDHVNHPCTVMKFERMISINSCIEVDLMGQVCSETIGLKQFSGTGGQVDYVRGAAMSAHGVSILAMPSTAAKGTISRIVPLLATGAAVTTSRNDVDYIVTEYGIAQLRGRSLYDRAKALIAIAHPDFREQLTEELNKRFPQK